jgi:hypothetical protein
MGSSDVADREQLEQATSLLMASLRESRALITALREAREQAEANERPQPADPSGGSIFEILRDVIDGASRR